MNERAAKEYLMKNDSQFRALVDEHQQFEKELQALAGKPFLTTDEQIHETVIKKKKLVVKDRIYSLIQRHRSEQRVH
jgi:uncharacterized protein YdcH (DUF465 family)